MTTDKDILSEEVFGPNATATTTEFEDGSVEIEIDALPDSPEKIGVVNPEDEHYRNLAEDYEDVDLLGIAEDCVEKFNEDEQSRADWMETTSSGLNLLGVSLEETDDPFPGACSAHHPLILESAVKFQAKAAAELLNPKGPVKVQVLGTHNDEKEAQASRVRNHMNYQFMHQMDEYFDETENLLFYLPIVGSAFKKVYYNAHLDRPCIEYVPIDQLVVNYHTSSLQQAYCITQKIQRTHLDLLKDIDQGLYVDIDLPEPSGSQLNNPLEIEQNEIMGFSDGYNSDDIHELIEHYTYLKLPDAPEDELPKPYIVTIHLETQKVLSIRKNWREDDELERRICPFVHYKFVPGMGFYGLGYVHLLGNLQMTLTSAMRSLIDSGTFANLQAGFVDKRLRIRSNEGPLSPGQFKEVEAGGIELDKAIKLIPFKEPSQVLMAMYQFVEGRAQKFADSTEQVVADSTNYGPVGTTMALLEASTKFFSGVHKRLHKAQKQEFKILAAINFTYLGKKESFDAIGKTFEISKEDYDGRIDISPVSDPNMNSQAQKLSVAQTVYTAALQNPTIHDLPEISKYYYRAIGVDEDLVDKFVPQEEEPTPLDPLSDILAVQQGKPIKAFPGQDHEAHIMTKQAFLQDPASGMNPAMQPLLPLIQANIQEHVVLKFQEQSQGAAQGSTEEMAVAQAAQQVAQQNQRLQELEAQGPDAARNKLADAEIMRVLNETDRQQNQTAVDQAKLALEAMKLELEKVKEDNKMLIAGIQEENKRFQEQFGNFMDIMKVQLEESKMESQKEIQKNAMKTQEVAPKEKKE